MIRPAAVLLVALLAGGCSPAGDGRASEAGSTPTSPPSTTTTAVTTTTSTTAAPVLVPWTGPVEHLFFHTLVIRPELAFTDDRLAQGFRDYFVTVDEFRAILDQLWANGWTLVDIHKAVRGQVMVPAGRKPLVVSEDDVNYYDDTRGRGLGWRLVLDPRGDVKVEVRDDRGTRVTDDDLVPIIDEFVVRHPEFSAEGAKGVLALTGYEGLFGERTDDPASPDHAASVQRATAIADRLKATGWTLASHSYGHIDLNERSITSIEDDARRWLAEATPVIGSTDVYIYPYGAAPGPGSPKVDLLRDLGFTIQCDIDKVPRLLHVDGVDVMSRRHIDGIAFAQQGANLRELFDVASVEDAAARAPG